MAIWLRIISQAQLAKLIMRDSMIGAGVGSGFFQSA
jgi:hypothetical protein